MDYGMVAPGPDVDPDTGRTTHLFNLRSLFSSLNVTRPNIAVVSDFISFINNDSSVTRPIGNIFLGAHSSAEGTITIQMIPKQKKENGKFFSNFETLQKAAATGSLIVEDSTIGPDPTKHFFHFKGCNIGRALPFLEEWKAVLGGKIQLSAPRFNHGAFNDQARGVWEFMVYEFVVTSPTPLEDRDALIQEFQKKKFRYVETIVGPGLQPGPLIPDGIWDSWLPNTIKTLIDLDGNKFIKRKDYPRHHAFSVQAAAPPFATLTVNEQFSADFSNFRKKIPNLSPMPTSQADRMAALQSFLLTDAENAPRASRYDVSKNHPFPMYKRWGYDSFAEFIAGFTWKFSNKSGSSDLFVKGTREEYTLFIGLTDPNPGPVTTDHPLLTNFHPTSPGNPPSEELPVTDLRFFQIM